MASPREEWRLKGTEEAASEGSDGTVVILDAGCTKAMCACYAFQHMKLGLSDDQVASRHKMSYPEGPAIEKIQSRLIA